MGASEKDKAILDATSGTGEPIYVLRGQDATAVDTIKGHMALATERGADQSYLEGVQGRINEFEAWGSQNPTKTPD